MEELVELLHMPIGAVALVVALGLTAWCTRLWNAQMLDSAKTEAKLDTLTQRVDALAQDMQTLRNEVHATHDRVQNGGLVADLVKALRAAGIQ